MKRLMILMLMLLAIGGTTQVYSQSWLKKVGKKVVNKVKEKTEDKVVETVDKTMDKAFDGAEDAVKGEGKGKKDNAADNTDAAEQVAQDGGQQSATMSWKKFDFVAGDEIIFEDNVVGEQLGEFPSMWDLKRGNAEIAEIDGVSCINLVGATTISPLMKEKDYLPDVFTIEFDVYYTNENDKTGERVNINDTYWFYLQNAKNSNVFKLNLRGIAPYYKPPMRVTWEWYSEGERNSGEDSYGFTRNAFNHISISFNKRALKVYLNDTRVVNIPRCDAPTKFIVEGYSAGIASKFIKNVRIAKGAVPLYDRMMSDGKFITYGITFDVGKSVIKPESMGEINRIVQLMNENPDLKFSVEGHTDSTGNATSNQTLSEARSKAIVDKLAELGIAADRLTSSGKGQTSPIADNGTDEGRAKNRRVEFVKQ